MLHLGVRGSLCFWCSYKVWKHRKSLFCPHCSDVPCPVWCVEGRDGVWGGSSSLLCLHCPVWSSWIMFFPWGVVLQVGWVFSCYCCVPPQPPAKLISEAPALWWPSGCSIMQCSDFSLRSFYHCPCHLHCLCNYFFVCLVQEKVVCKKGWFSSQFSMVL